ncbi:MAG: hypothetical protein HDT19_07430 [Oscillibacter sp.]|nr:hypothetical protein [Oscillibacter sp.]
MAKGKKKAPPPWLTVLEGLGLSLGLYLLGILLVTLLAVRGTLSENGLFPAVAVVCGLSALCGGLLCGRRPFCGTLPSALLPAAVFAALLAAVGVLCWDAVAWTGRGGALLLCALAGGLAAGLISAAGSRRGKGRRRLRVL